MNPCMPVCASGRLSASSRTRGANGSRRAPVVRYDLSHCFELIVSRPGHHLPEHPTAAPPADVTRDVTALFLRAEQSGLKLAIVARTVTLVLLGAWLVGTRAEDPTRAAGYAILVIAFRCTRARSLRADRHPLRQELGQVPVRHARRRDRFGAGRDAAALSHGRRSACGHDLPRADLSLLLRHSRHLGAELLAGRGGVDRDRGLARLAPCLPARRVAMVPATSTGATSLRIRPPSRCCRSCSIPTSAGSAAASRRRSRWSSSPS